MPDILTRLVLFGDDFGISNLMARIDSDRIACIVAASNRPHMHAPVQSMAQRAKVPFLIQPSFTDTASYAHFVGALSALSPDSAFSHSYSMLVQADILALVEGRAFNIHASLLPKNRGPSPLQWALIHDDAETGVTLHVMDTRFDGGAIIDQEPFPINDEDTWVTLTKRLAPATHSMLDRTLPTLLNGQWRTLLQDESRARANPRIDRDGLAIDFAHMTDRQVFNLIRAQVAPLKGAYIPHPEGRLYLPNFVPLIEIPALRASYA